LAEWRRNMLQNVNGITLYYEKTGEGQPIILLHGNGEDHQIFDVLTDQLKENFSVYAIDSRGHGKSTRVRELDYRSMAEDIAEFIKILGLVKPILYGFSDGGIIGLIIAYTYPELLSKLIISGANLTPEGVKKRYLNLFRFLYYITRNPNFRLMVTQPHISVEELHKIVVPTLVLAGSKDLIKEEHTIQIAEAIPNCTLQILTGEDHLSYVVNSNKLYPIMKPFLSEEDVAKWIS
jgi:pimeloyl-ACP methyl ester carboxylesterase